jgi:hypothetical protein
MDPRDEPADLQVLHLLQPGERVELGLGSFGAELRVTDRRLLVTDADAVRLDIPYERLRRIEFDLEAGRAATLVVVPHHPDDEPQVLSVPSDQLHVAAELLAFVGERLPHRAPAGGAASPELSAVEATRAYASSQAPPPSS